MPDGSAADRVLRRLREDFEFYAPRVLKIKDKNGVIVPLELNREQRYTHAILEKQRAETGKVRAIIVKPRQRGISTYIEGRFYHQTSMRSGRGAFILTHRDDATKNLFDMVDRFYANDGVIHPHVDRSNAKQLRFDRLDSGYGVATAGGDPGRSFTFQLFHGSEVAYWKNPEGHMAAIGQAIPNAPGTEIVLESTGNGRGNFFHGKWQEAEAGEGEYAPIFFPWFWAEDYRLKLPAGGFDFSIEDREYQELHGISDEQLYWRRMKIIDDFRGDETLFAQEYPATAVEAFMKSEGSFITSADVMRCRKTKIEDPVGALIVGADPTSYGDDRFALCWRRGRKMLKREAHRNFGTMQCVGRIAQIIDRDKPAKVFVDVVGIGAGVVDRLRELGYEDIVVGVAGSEKPVDPLLHFNLRAQMYDDARSWMQQPGGAELVDDDELEADLVACGFKYESNGQRLRIESKEDLRARGIRSPDNADAFVLTFAHPVSDTAPGAVLPAGRRAPHRVQRRERDWRARL